MTLRAHSSTFVVVYVRSLTSNLDTYTAMQKMRLPSGEAGSNTNIVHEVSKAYRRVHSRRNV